jgi:hypothetical protein
VSEDRVPTDSDAPPVPGIGHHARRERLIGGVRAATVVVCWFALVDALTVGKPWYTAERIGAATASIAARDGQAPALGTAIVLFLLVHYAGWIALASVTLGVVHRAERHPTMLLAAVLMSILVQLFLVGIIALLAEMGWGGGAWLRFGAGALVGGVALAMHAYRTHPDFVRFELAHMGDDEE